MGSEHSGIGGLPYVAGISRKIVVNRVYTAQGILERINVWMLPNHKAYVAITVHLEHEGIPLSMLLNLVEVVKSHSGVNLAAAFTQVLQEFGISNKVLVLSN